MLLADRHVLEVADELATLGFAVPDSARQWAQCSPATSRRIAEHGADQVHDE